MKDLTFIEWVIIILFVLTALVCSPLAEADEVGIITASYHLDRTREYNEINPGAYWAGEKWTLAAYKNSYNQLSVFVGGHVEVFRRGRLAIELNGGIITGYAKSPTAFYALDDPRLYGKDVLPVMFPRISYDINERVKLNIYSMWNVYSFGMGYKF